ncbi:MAG: hypothetical protein M1827_007707 [Pycnora praestabilis]|nr:MAG: hypothetical protein M1827_007707 [Pycnora praestabilis]
MPVPTTSANGSNGESPRPKVLVPEKLSPDGVALLRSTLDVDERKGLSPEELISVIPGYEALIVRSETKVTKDVLVAGKNLRVVARAGVGVDNVDVNAATAHGIIVVNSPAGNIGAAAEHTVALLLAVARNIPDGCASLKAGKWERSRLVGVEVKGKMLGIIGLGKGKLEITDTMYLITRTRLTNMILVGLSVARLATGLGMHVTALDPYASTSLAATANVALVQSLPALLAVSDFLTIHTPLIASTKGMIGTAELRSMKKGARILNVARGGMIDETALLGALEEGHIAGAGVDVFTTEPPTAEGEAAKLIAHPKVVATPHLGASTVEAQENVSIDVCEQVLSILRGELPRSAVNAPLILPEEYRKLQPFVKLVEKMGSLYTQRYTTSSRNRQSQDFRTSFDLIYEGEVASIGNTKPLFAALVKGLTQSISPNTNINIVNADMIAKERGISINEQHSRDPMTHTYSSLVTLRARPARSTSQPPSPTTTRHERNDGSELVSTEQVISGSCSDGQVFISRLDRFATSFVPDGTLLICHNYDSPGMIGVVGSILGKAGVNISFMSVAPVSAEGRLGAREKGGEGLKNEALMILGVGKAVETNVVTELMGDSGILDISVVTL